MDQVIRNAEAKLESLSSDTKTIALYRAREAALHERANMINSVKAEGREEGKTEGELETAANLLLMGIDRGSPLFTSGTEYNPSIKTKLCWKG
ncbi:MAG: hypothetical protein PVG90_07790 [Bacillota bacterium]